MKKYKVFGLLMVLLIGTSTAFAQGKYFTREGFISFHSDTEVEQIHADNYKVTSVMDSETGKLEFAVLMKAFEFEKALMEEHFNENYVESDKFPKAIFKGEIIELDKVDWSKNGEYSIKVKGALTIHGVTNEIIEDGSITVENEKLLAYSKFMINISDYDISIPKVVVKNISEEVEVEVKMNYQKLTKS